MKQTFDEFLQEKFFDNYHGVKDDFEEAFDSWLSDLDGEDYINLGNEYGRKLGLNNL